MSRLASAMAFSCSSSMSSFSRSIASGSSGTAKPWGRIHSRLNWFSNFLLKARTPIALSRFLHGAPLAPHRCHRRAANSTVVLELRRVGHPAPQLSERLGRRAAGSRSGDTRSAITAGSQRSTMRGCRTGSASKHEFRRPPSWKRRSGNRAPSAPYAEAAISTLRRATVELLKPTCLATSLIPIPLPSACRAFSRASGLFRGLPNVLPLATARLSPACMR